MLKFNRLYFFIHLFNCFTFNDFLVMMKARAVEKRQESSTMQKARGEAGEVILVIPPSLWDGELGILLRELFTSKVKVTSTR